MSLVPYKNKSLAVAKSKTTLKNTCSYDDALRQDRYFKTMHKIAFPDSDGVEHFLAGLFFGAGGLISAVATVGAAHDLPSAATTAGLGIVGVLAARHSVYAINTFDDAPGNKHNIIIRNRVRRQMKKLDKQYGWRPRPGMPHPRGRTDTYPRHVVETKAQSGGLYTVSTYRFYYYDNRWNRDYNAVHAFRDLDEADMHTKHQEMLAEAAVFNEESQISFHQAKQLPSVSDSELTAESMNSLQTF